MEGHFCGLKVIKFNLFLFLICQIDGEFIFSKLDLQSIVAVTAKSNLAICVGNEGLYNIRK